jgi:NAD(P)-dependent dehydrogenase (short-subunit alcohol dehydrogenase family)
MSSVGCTLPSQWEQEFDMAQRNVAVVTGTSSGIGLHTAVGLASRGIRVVATMRDTSRASALLAEAADQGVEVAVRELDVTDRDGARRCLDEVEADFGPIGILVNNAGRGIGGTLEQLDDAALQEQLDVTFLGPAALARHVLPSMRKAGSGRIISVSSVGGVFGEPFLDAYCASKFALEGLMQSLAPVAARFGVVVSVVEPGAVGTNVLANSDTSAMAPTANWVRSSSQHSMGSSWPRNTRATRLRSSSRRRPPKLRASAGRPPTRPRPSPACRWRT